MTNSWLADPRRSLLSPIDQMNKVFAEVLQAGRDRYVQPVKDWAVGLPQRYEDGRRRNAGVSVGDVLGIAEQGRKGQVKATAALVKRAGGAATDVEGIRRTLGKAAGNLGLLGEAFDVSADLKAGKPRDVVAVRSAARMASNKLAGVTAGGAGAGAGAVIGGGLGALAAGAGAAPGMGAGAGLGWTLGNLAGPVISDIKGLDDFAADEAESLYLKTKKTPVSRR